MSDNFATEAAQATRGGTTNSYGGASELGGAITTAELGGRENAGGANDLQGTGVTESSGGQNANTGSAESVNGGTSATEPSVVPGGTGGAHEGGTTSTAPNCTTCIYCIEATLATPQAITLSDTSAIGTNASLWGPCLSADGLTLYFAVTGTTSGREQIFSATRNARDSVEFSNIRAVFGTATDSRGTPYLSSDGVTLYLYSNRSDGAGDRDIWFASNQGPGSALGNLQPVAAANTDALEHMPTETADRLTLYYVASSSTYAADSLTGGDIWKVSRASAADAYASPVAVTELNTTYGEGRVAITSDSRVVYFASTRASSGTNGYYGYSQWDIWTASRDEASGAFKNVALVTDSGLNSTNTEMDLALSSDNTELFFVSNRNGKTWIYRSARQCK